MVRKNRFAARTPPRPWFFIIRWVTPYWHRPSPATSICNFCLSPVTSYVWVELPHCHHGPTSSFQHAYHQHVECIQGSHHLLFRYHIVSTRAQRNTFYISRVACRKHNQSLIKHILSATAARCITPVLYSPYSTSYSTVSFTIVWASSDYNGLSSHCFAPYHLLAMFH